MSNKPYYQKKRFGQHWLINQKILEKIKTVSELNDRDFILEIGPGKGALTSKLLNSNISSLHAVELDKDLIFDLNKKFINNRKFTLHHGDILSINLDLIYPKVTKVIANIPYNITGPLLEKFLGRLGKINKYKFKKVIFLMQKDVVDRIIAKKGSSNSGALSIRIQLISDVEKICDVKASCFSPPPKVSSSLVVFKPKEFDLRLNLEHEKNIDKLLRVAFNGRRKKLKNTLNSIISSDDFEKIMNIANISLDKRPQDLSVNEWIKLADICSNINVI